MEMSQTCAAPLSLAFHSLLCKVIKNKKNKEKRKKRAIGITQHCWLREMRRQSGLADLVLVFLGALISPVISTIAYRKRVYFKRKIPIGYSPQKGFKFS